VLHATSHPGEYIDLILFSDVELVWCVMKKPSNSMNWIFRPAPWWAPTVGVCDNEFEQGGHEIERTMVTHETQRFFR
jgi:hypothetical protein